MKMVKAALARIKLRGVLVRVIREAKQCMQSRKKLVKHMQRIYLMYSTCCPWQQVIYLPFSTKSLGGATD